MMCRQEGHNRTTCPLLKKQVNVAIAAAKAEQDKKVAERLAAEKKAAEEKIAAEKAAAAAAEETRIAQEKVDAINKEAAEKKAAERARLEAELEADYQKCLATTEKKPIIKKDPVLVLIFEKLYDRNASMEYLNLREHWNAHPEDFKMLGTEHASKRDISRHYTLEIRKKFNYINAHDGSPGSKVWVSYYHLHYVVNPDNKLKWTDLTTTDRHSNAYTIAKFNNP